MKSGTTWLILIILVFLQFLTPDHQTPTTTKSLAAEITRVDPDPLFPEAIAPSCPSPQSDLPSDRLDYPTRLIIDMNRPRAWSKNAFEAWLSLEEFGGFTQQFKENYDATVTLEYTDGQRCIDQARVRIHGDGQDHLRTVSGLQSSLDVRLTNEHLAGLVHFKLLLPETRHGDNEIFATTLFDELGFLTPRTFYIDTTVNGQNVQYLVQEKFRKELLEYRLIPESPIFQVDERFGYLWTEHTDSEDVIANPHIFTTSRLSNQQFAERGPVAMAIVEEGLARLNQVYAQVAASKPGATRVDQLPGTIPGTGLPVSRIITSATLPILIGSTSPEPSEASKFTALFLALGSDNVHGLKSHNQRFVYDPWLGIVRPIYYDGQISLIKRELSSDNQAKQWLKEVIGFVEHEFTPVTDLSLTLVTPATALAATVLRQELASIELSSFVRRLAQRGMSITEHELHDLIGLGGIIDRNLAVITSSGNLNTTDYIPAELFTGIHDPSIRIVFGSIPSGQFTQCFLHDGQCTALWLSDEQQVLLLRGALTIEDIDYLYVGNSITHYKAGLIQSDHLASDWQHITLVDETTLSTNGFVTIEIDHIERILHLSTSTPHSRSVIWNGKLDNWTVIYQGPEVSKPVDFQQTERHDFRGLTGCLTFRDVKLSNLTLKAIGGDCEDSIHFLRVSGDIAQIQVADAFQDAIDMDYSELEISTMTVQKAGNDCLDISAGIYVFAVAELERCGDKAVSIGEAARSDINSLLVAFAPTGVASKDSSSVNISQARFTDVGVCATVYRKKQAYSGGSLLLQQSNCASGDYRQQDGSRLLFTVQ